MARNTNTGAQRPVVALYTPSLQGLYLGELVNQIRQLSFIKDYRLIVIRTGGVSDFDTPLQLNDFDAAIILRNAVSAEFAELLVTSGIPCVSIAYDYFPLNIPVITCDNSAGTTLAFNHLRELGHAKVAFIGDLGHYDIRKRYEQYCHLHDQQQLPLREDYLITVSDNLFANGVRAAERFLQQNCDATGIIFGAGQTGVGFVQQMRRQNAPASANLHYVCFDALSLIPVYCPQMASVDQNLHLVAYRAFNAVDKQLAGVDCEMHTMVTPKLICVSGDDADRYDPFIATCVDLPELHNPNYIKSLICNMQDWPNTAVQSHMDQLMSIAPLFAKFMAQAVLSRFHLDSNGTAWIKVSKLFTPSDTVQAELSDSQGLCKARHFPAAWVEEAFAQHDTCFHLPIVVQGKIWGFLSLLGDAACATPASSYFAFSAYMEVLVGLYEKDLELQALRKQLRQCTEDTAPAAKNPHTPNATVEWQLSTNHSVWNDAALACLGYSSAVEQNIYRHLDITDRLHHDDLELVRRAITAAKADKTSCRFDARYRTKNGVYSRLLLNADPRLDQDQKLVGFVFTIRKHEPCEQ